MAAFRAKKLLEKKQSVKPKQLVQALKEPSKYKVVLLNDDYTPMDFVVKILETLFGFNEATAMAIMLTVHMQGRAVCGIFTHEIAETKMFQVNQVARKYEYPLLCCIEPDTLNK